MEFNTCVKQIGQETYQLFIKYKEKMYSETLVITEKNESYHIPINQYIQTLTPTRNTYKDWTLTDSELTIHDIIVHYIINTYSDSYLKHHKSTPSIAAIQDFYQIQILFKYSQDNKQRLMSDINTTLKHYIFEGIRYHDISSRINTIEYQWAMAYVIYTQLPHDKINTESLIKILHITYDNLKRNLYLSNKKYRYLYNLIMSEIKKLIPIYVRYMRHKNRYGNYEYVKRLIQVDTSNAPEPKHYTWPHINANGNYRTISSVQPTHLVPYQLKGVVRQPS